MTNTKPSPSKLPELEPIMICPTCHDLYGSSYWEECCNGCCTLENKKGVKLEAFYGTTQLNKYKHALAQRLNEILTVSYQDRMITTRTKLHELIAELEKK